MNTNEWDGIITVLDHATGQSLYKLNDYELDRLEVLLDHWHKLARSVQGPRHEKAKLANVTQ